MSILTKSTPFASLFFESVLKEESLATELLTTDPSKKSIQKTCKSSNGATSSLEEGFGILPLGGPATLPTKPFGRVHAPASRSRTPVKEPELPIQGIYGPTFTDLLPPPNQVSSLVNRLVLNLGMIGSTESPLTWKVKTTNAKRSIYRLVPSTRPTREIDYIGSLDYWGTPDEGRKGQTAPESTPKRHDHYGMKAQVSLRNQVKQYVADATGRSELRQDESSGLFRKFANRGAGYGNETVGDASFMFGNVGEYNERSDREFAQESPKFGNDGYWNEYEWRTGKDGKSRRVKPGIRLLVNGIPRRVDKLAYRRKRNRTVPLAEEFIKAYIESREGEVSV